MLIPHDELEERIDEIEVYKNFEIIVYCRGGSRSQVAREILVECGFTKVYNMLGGILAWIDADYPIWTSSHYITADGNSKVQIEPLLLQYTGCTSCNENHECPHDHDSATMTSTVLVEEEDYIETLITYETDDITYEYTFAYTLLWSYSESDNEINRTARFIMTEITTGETYERYYTLYYLVNHAEYNLSVYTDLSYLNSEIYNSSFTYIKYFPINGGPLLSMELIKFNSSVGFSEHYDILSKISGEVEEIYKNADDENLKQLAPAYSIMQEEIKSLSKLVEKQLSDYDQQILISNAILADMHYPGNGGGGTPPPPPPSGCYPSGWECFLDTIICGVAIGLILGCAIFSWGNFWICVWGIGGVAQEVICACIAMCCCVFGNEVCCKGNCAC